jgi:hypothetical protein
MRERELIAVKPWDIVEERLKPVCYEYRLAQLSCARHAFPREVYRSSHEKVVAAGRRDLERQFGALLALDVAQVRLRLARRAHGGLRPRQRLLPLKWLASCRPVMRFAGSARPEAVSAERTRSCDSRTALSPRPTMLNTTFPEATCTCTSTGRHSTPSNATVETRATMFAPPGLPLSEHLQNIARGARGKLTA